MTAGLGLPQQPTRASLAQRSRHHSPRCAATQAEGRWTLRNGGKPRKYNAKMPPALQAGRGRPSSEPGTAEFRPALHRGARAQRKDRPARQRVGPVLQRFRPVRRDVGPAGHRRPRARPDDRLVQPQCRPAQRPEGSRNIASSRRTSLFGRRDNESGLCCNDFDRCAAALGPPNIEVNGRDPVTGLCNITAGQRAGRTGAATSRSTGALH